jgi:ABC-type arginine/histidine transport system permease subunit
MASCRNENERNGLWHQLKSSINVALMAIMSASNNETVNIEGEISAIKEISALAAKAGEMAKCK